MGYDMKKEVGIGIQSFEEIIKGNCFYVDKTLFIKEWWESRDSVTLINRPRRFGKTLNMSMLQSFFSVGYKDRGDLFEGLSIWKEEKYRELQGSYPVIYLSFANIKEKSFAMTRKKICQLITELYSQYDFLMENEVCKKGDMEYCQRVNLQMDDADASLSIHYLAKLMFQYYGKKAIILLDEYDTPMQEAYINGFWDDLVSFTRNLFNSTFKTNPYMERAIMTGITRGSKESIFSDLNNPEVITTTSNQYTTAFGFTEDEVFSALEEYGYEDRKDEVKRWYDGFIFGKQKDIYNPWSILNFLKKGVTDTYWANTSGNGLVSKLVREGNRKIKNTFEDLLNGKTIFCPIDEQIVYDQLDDNMDAVFSLLVAGGYLKVLSYEEKKEAGRQPLYELGLTNEETKDMFYTMVRGWFRKKSQNYNEFIDAFLLEDLDAMNDYMNLVSEEMFSSFDTGNTPSRLQPERFYHGFVLGLIVDLREQYVITSNRESGFGRYDIMMEPLDKNQSAFILEFKVLNPRKEKSLEECVQSALAQIEKKHYEADLIARGIPKEKIHKYGFAFEGKKVLIG